MTGIKRRLSDSEKRRLRYAAATKIPLLLTPATKRLIARVLFRHGISWKVIVGYSRGKWERDARRELIWTLAAARPDMSLSGIGKIVRRDHKTIHTTLKTHQRLVSLGAVTPIRGLTAESGRVVLDKETRLAVRAEKRRAIVDAYAESQDRHVVAERFRVTPQRVSELVARARRESQRAQP